MASSEESIVDFCYRHPHKETSLRCGRCNKPICVKCARLTQVGYRCPDCLYMLSSRHYANGTYVDPLSAPRAKPIITYVLLALLVLVWGIQELLGGSLDNGVLLQLGSTSGERIMQGEIWRLFMAMFLHIGITHLFFNGFALFSIGRDVESYFGYGRYLLIYVASGLFGNIVSFAIRGPAEFSAGASGAIFGLIGAELGLLLFHRRQLGEYGKEQRKNIWRLILINLAIGLAVFSINNAAHIGGFVAGLVLGFGVAPRFLPAIDSTGTNIYEDQASLQKRWGIPLIAILVLATGLWGSIYLWQNYETQMQEISLRIQYLPFTLPTLFASDPLEFYDEEFQPPEPIKLDDVFQCYPSFYEDYRYDDYSDFADDMIYCTGYLEVIDGPVIHQIDLAKISENQQFSLGFTVYAYEGDVQVVIENIQGEIMRMRTESTVSPSASSYIGIVSSSFTISIEATDGRAEMVNCTITLEPVE